MSWLQKTLLRRQQVVVTLAGFDESGQTVYQDFLVTVGGKQKVVSEKWSSTAKLRSVTVEPK